MPQSQQPQIDPALMFLRSRVEMCNHLVDLYGSYCDVATAFTVEAVALSGTLIDITDLCEKSRFKAWDAMVNENGAGQSEHESRTLDHMFGDNREFLDLLGIGA